MAMTPRPPSAGLPRPGAGDDALSGEDLLARGAAALREEPTTRWIELQGRVLSAVRAAGRRSWELEASWPARPGASGLPDASGDVLRVSDQVVVAAVRAALAGLPGAAPSRIAVTVEGHRCTGAEVDLVARFGTDLRELGSQARALTLFALAEVLGPAPEGLGREASVEVRYSDVTPGDPRL